MTCPRWYRREAIIPARSIAYSVTDFHKYRTTVFLRIRRGACSHDLTLPRNNLQQREHWNAGDSRQSNTRKLEGQRSRQYSATEFSDTRSIR